MTWQYSTLDDIAEYIGRGRSPVYEDESGYPVLNQACIQHGRLDLSKLKSVSQAHFLRLEENRKTRHGDVFVNSTGTGTLGRIAFWDDDSTIAFDGHVTLVRLKPDYDPRFFFYQLHTPEAQSQILNDCISGSTNQIELSRAAFRNIRIRYPAAKTKQTAIASILATVDQAITQTEALIAKQRRIKAGLLHDLLTRGIDEQGNLRDPATHKFKASPVGWVPAEWEVRKLTEVCEAIVDCPHSTPNYSDEGIPCIRTADLEPGHILLEQAYRVSEEDYWTRTRRLIPAKGDIIYSREGERLGIAGLVKNERVCLGQRVMHIRPGSGTDSDFLLWVLNSSAILKQVNLSVSSTTSPHVNVEDVSRFLVQVPSSSEQFKIGEILSAQSQLSETERTNLTKLHRLKTGLMQDLLTGRVPVAGLVAAGCAVG